MTCHANNSRSSCSKMIFHTCIKLAVVIMITSFTLCVAFQPSQNFNKHSFVNHHQLLSDNNRLTTTPPSYIPSARRISQTALNMAIPKIDNWQITKSGNVVGIVTNHPVINDGDVITTSPLKNPNGASRMSIVSTETGSKYKLGEPKMPARSAQLSRKTQKAVAAAVKEEKETAPAAAPAKKPMTFFGRPEPKEAPPAPAPTPNPLPPKQQSKKPAAGAVNGSSNTKTGQIARPRSTGTLQVPPSIKTEYQLTGEYVGPDAKYLLSDRPLTSTSGKSTIHKAYLNNYSNQKVGQPLTIKISSNEEAMEREVSNYARMVNSGLLQRGGKFVTVYEFLRAEDLETSSNRYRGQCALVMERGDIDLKRYINENGPFKGKGLRDAAAAAARCVESLHTSSLVWTDLKSENFVVIMDKKTSTKMSEVKGIDLESAMPIRDNPVDYSPEACPPEFASSFLEGEGPYFELQYSYDIWSLGMLFYELATGCGVFDGKTPLQITRLLSKQQQFINAGSSSSVNGDNSKITGGEGKFDPSLEPINLDGFDDVDPRFKDLVESCLTVDPRKRPSISQVLLHPYFLTTGVGPFSF